MPYYAKDSLGTPYTFIRKTTRDQWVAGQKGREIVGCREECPRTQSQRVMVVITDDRYALAEEALPIDDAFNDIQVMWGAKLKLNGKWVEDEKGTAVGYEVEA